MHGSEWLVEAYGCRPGALANATTVRALFDRLIDALSLTVVGEPAWHQFPPPGGITGLALLSESHLACHTFPEYGSLCLNVFCCRPRSEWDVETVLRTLFGATSVRVRRLDRPYGHAPVVPGPAPQAAGLPAVPPTRPAIAT